MPINIDDYSRALLDPAACSYSFQRRADGLVVLSLRYGFVPAAPAVSVESAEVLLPVSSAVREVLVDGAPAIWSFSGGKLSISVKESSASIEALCELPAGAESASCASVVFKRDGAQGFEVVDFLPSVGSPITLRAPEVTASGSFTVRGKAPAGTEVSLSVGGAVVGAATASQTGSYSAEVSIPSPERRRVNVGAGCPTKIIFFS